MVTSAVLAADSLPRLYRAVGDELTAILRDRLRVVIYEEPLVDLLGYLVTSRSPSATRALVVAADATAAERVYLFVHTAAHVLLGHADRPFSTILEPRRGRARGARATCQLTDTQLRQDQQADLLTGAILWGCRREAGTALERYAVRRDPLARQAALEAAGVMSGLLLGHKYPNLQRALVCGLARKAVLQGLRLARAAYHGLSGVRAALTRGAVVRDLREIYYLTELVTVVPELAPSWRRGLPAADLRPAPGELEQASPIWLELARPSAEPPASRREDPSRRN